MQIYRTAIVETVESCRYWYLVPVRYLVPTISQSVWGGQALGIGAGRNIIGKMGVPTVTHADCDGPWYGPPDRANTWF